jgi:hypothetical protein
MVCNFPESAVFKALSGFFFFPCSNRCCGLPVCFGLEQALIADNFNDFKANR